MALADMRKDYGLAGLLEKDLAKNPFRQFEKWFAEAEAAKIPEPNAMTLATTSRAGRPRDPRRGRGLFSQPAAGEPARGVGLAPEHPDRGPGRARGELPRGGEEIRGPRGAVAAAVGRLPAVARDRGVLAGPPQPPPRPASLPAGRRWRLGRRASRLLTHAAPTRQGAG